jgi:hypothetical protein
MIINKSNTMCLVIIFIFNGMKRKKNNDLKYSKMTHMQSKIKDMEKEREKKEIKKSLGIIFQILNYFPLVCCCCFN